MMGMVPFSLSRQLLSILSSLLHQDLFCSITLLSSYSWSGLHFFMLFSIILFQYGSLFSYFVSPFPFLILHNCSICDDGSCNILNLVAHFSLHYPLVTCLQQCFSCPALQYSLDSKYIYTRCFFI